MDYTENILLLWSIVKNKMETSKLIASELKGLKSPSNVTNMFSRKYFREIHQEQINNILIRVVKGQIENDKYILNKVLDDIHRNISVNDPETLNP